MPVLTVGDKQVTVGDEFLKLSPDQQNATVDEIATSLGVKPAAPAAPAGAPVTVDNVGRSLATGVPIVGGLLNKANAATGALLAPAVEPFMEAGPNSINDAPGETIMDRLGARYKKALAIQDGMDKKFSAEHPVVDVGAKLVGGVASMAPVMMAAPAAWGLAGPTMQMARNGAVSSAALSGADAAVRGEDIGTAAAVGGVIGGVAGPVGKGVGKVVSSIADRVRPPAAAVPQSVSKVGDVDVPMAPYQVSRDPAAGAEAEVIRRGGRGDAAQAEAIGFDELQGARVGQVRDEFAASLDPSGASARTSPQDAAEKIAGELIAKEQAAQAARSGALAGEMSPAQSADDLARAFGGGQVRAATPFDAAESLSEQLAAGNRAAKADYRGKYDAVAAAPGEFSPGSAAGFRGDVENGLRAADNPVSLDPTNTPKSLRALQIIDDNLNMTGPGAPKPAAPGAALDPVQAQTVADIRAKFGDDVAAAYERQTAAAKPAPAPAAGGNDELTSIKGVDWQNINRSEGGGLLDRHSVSVAGGGSVEVAPKVVEASSLKTSADTGYDAALQPRDRSRAASSGQVNDIAKNLNPQRLGRSAEADRGAPIVGADGMVESGNGRIQAIRQAYQEGGPSAAKYREWLQSQGVDVANMREPVLIRERVTAMTPEQRQSFTVGANQGATLTMSAPELALADAKLISGNSLSLIKNPGDISSVDNSAFVRQFAAKLPQTEQGAFVNAQGQLSAEGATRVRNAVLAKAYGDSAVLTRIAESTHDDVRSISNALTSSAPEWAAVREGVAAGSIPKEMDITADLLDAVARTAQIRARGAGLAEATAQVDAFNKQSPTSEQLMRLFYDADGRRAASSSQIRDGLRFYAQEAAKVEASPGLMLGLPQVTPGEILELTAMKVAAPKEISREVMETAAKNAATAEKVTAAAEAPGSGFTMREVEQVRKQLSTLYGDARRAMMAGGSGADLYALDHIRDRFDDRVAKMIADGKFSGDGPAVAKMQSDARASFADYKQKFSKRGAGDDVGAAVEKILGKFSDTRATPDTVLKLAYGPDGMHGPGAPGGQMAVQIAQRIERIFGRNSEEFATYKQGLFAKLSAGEPEAVAARIEAFLSEPKGRVLAQTVFDAGERAALGRYAGRLGGLTPQAVEPGAAAAAIRRYSGADGSPPASANQIVNDLFGATGKGNGRISVDLAVRLKQELTPEGWSAVRQGMFEKLTNAGEGKIAFEAQALSQRLHEFLNESGSQLSRALYSPKELELLGKMAAVYKQMIPVKGTTNPSGTAPMLAKMAGGLRQSLLPLLGLTAGGLPGAVVGAVADKGLTSVANAGAARKATSLFYGEQAKRPAKDFAKGSGLAARGPLEIENQRRRSR